MPIEVMGGFGLLYSDMSFSGLNDEQVISLAHDAQARREERMRLGEAQLRHAGSQRGLEWDRLSEDERESFVVDFLREK
jgi:hypothetical protein